MRLAIFSTIVRLNPGDTVTIEGPDFLPGEAWRQVPSSPRYWASSKGRIWATRDWARTQAKLLPQHVGNSGYLSVSIQNGPGHTLPSQTVHSLVAEAFFGPRPEGLEVCHGPGGKFDNSLANLRYDTRSANQLDSVREGTHWQVRKVVCPRDHELADWNCIRRDLKVGIRSCKACNQAQGILCRKPAEERAARMQSLADEKFEAIQRRHRESLIEVIPAEDPEVVKLRDEVAPTQAELDRVFCRELEREMQEIDEVA